MKNKRAVSGFSLIELMVVVAIIGVLLAIAVPSYNQYQVKARRALAQTFLMNIANKQEQFRLDSRTYTNVIGAGGLALTAPPELAPHYTFAVAGTAVGGSATLISDFTATATAIGGQASDGNLTITDTGVKTGKW